jgi:hypothetical protein
MFALLKLMVEVLTNSFKYRLMPEPQNALKIYALFENSV